MPLTFCHPLAVLPLHRIFAKKLNFSALVIGSMSPDFGYYMLQFPAAMVAHTALGALLVCMPSSLVVLALFYKIREPICHLLPQPHREALLQFSSTAASTTASTTPALNLRVSSFFIAAISAVLGAMTHIIWDSFTHFNGWGVSHIALLQIPVMQSGNSTLEVNYFLQQISTFGGGAVLIWLYFRWLRHVQKQSQNQQPLSKIEHASSDRWRYILFLSIATLAMVIAAPPAYKFALQYQDGEIFRAFIFRWTVYSSIVFFAFLSGAAVVIAKVQRKYKL